ncbi:hypothetical protein L6164_001165 [Bauhinia variegata]|uniref:Uncharacterized protein n=1 Tax=Bauhinia variegata TaxID=167791 RepID=A0ACB9QF85_BAUVA|nr:hypothetical protein L6164_001165 [Bauhinia variegata]
MNNTPRASFIIHGIRAGSDPALTLALIFSAFTASSSCSSFASMANASTSSDGSNGRDESSIDASSPYFLYYSNHPGSLLISEKLMEEGSILGKEL